MRGRSAAAAHVFRVGWVMQDSAKTLQEYFDSSDVKEVSQRPALQCSSYCFCTMLHS
jgi:hypothetical protein